jgi:hypothetical protein
MLKNVLEVTSLNSDIRDFEGTETTSGNHILNFLRYFSKISSLHRDNPLHRATLRTQEKDKFTLPCASHVSCT